MDLNIALQSLELKFSINEFNKFNSMKSAKGMD